MSLKKLVGPLSVLGLLLGFLFAFEFFRESGAAVRTPTTPLREPWFATQRQLLLIVGVPLWVRRGVSRHRWGPWCASRPGRPRYCCSGHGRWHGCPRGTSRQRRRIVGACVGTCVCVCGCDVLMPVSGAAGRCTLGSSCSPVSQGYASRSLRTWPTRYVPRAFTSTHERTRAVPCTMPHHGMALGRVRIRQTFTYLWESNIQAAMDHFVAFVGALGYSWICYQCMEMMERRGARRRSAEAEERRKKQKRPKIDPDFMVSDHDHES